jgi:hypothetical protein
MVYPLNRIKKNHVIPELMKKIYLPLMVIVILLVFALTVVV